MPPTSRLGHLSAQLQPSGAAAGATSGDYPVARHPDGSPVAPSVLPGRTPLDIRLGLTQPEGVAHPLRWGILGAAKICEDWARALRDVPGATAVAVAARSQDSAQAFADKMGLPKAYEGYEALAADPDIDIVYIGTITALHKEHALMCIAAGTAPHPPHPSTATAPPFHHRAPQANTCSWRSRSPYPRPTRKRCTTRRRPRASCARRACGRATSPPPSTRATSSSPERSARSACCRRTWAG